MAAQEREREEATPPSESNFVTAPPRKAKGLAFIPSSAGELLHRCQIYHPRYPICTHSPLIVASPLPSSSLLFRNVVWSGSKPDGGATISRPQKRLRINVPLLLPSLLRPRPITLDSPPPGADYNYRAFCFAIRRGSSPPPRVGASKIPLIFQPAPLCVESSEKTPHLTSFIIVNHRPEMIGGIYFIFRHGRKL